jgi:hypothetical protein
MSRRYVAVTVETPHLITVSGPIDHKIAGKQKKYLSDKSRQIGFFAAPWNIF